MRLAAAFLHHYRYQGLWHWAALSSTCFMSVFLGSYSPLPSPPDRDTDGERLTEKLRMRRETSREPKGIGKMTGEPCAEDSFPGPHLILTGYLKSIVSQSLQKAPWLPLGWFLGSPTYPLSGSEALRCVAQRASHRKAHISLPAFPQYVLDLVAQEETYFLHFFRKLSLTLHVQGSAFVQPEGVAGNSPYTNPWRVPLSPSWAHSQTVFPVPLGWR